MILLAKKEGSKTAPKDLLKGSIPEKFTLLGKDDKGDNKIVESYAKHMTPHILNHYDAFVMSTTNALPYPINLADMIYYSTYGDYRMYLAGDKIKFRYHAISDLNTRSTLTTNFQNPLIRAGRPDHLYGVYNRTAGLTAREDQYEFNIEEIKALSNELNTASGGIRLMLPSIGTMIAMTYGYTNINEQLNKIFQGLLVLIDKNMSEVKVGGNDFDIFDYMEEALTHENLHGANYTVFANPGEITALIAQCKKERDDNKIGSAVELLANSLIKKDVSQFADGDEVTFAPKASVRAALFTELEAALPNEDVKDAKYIIRAPNYDPARKKYEYSLEYTSGPEAGNLCSIPVDQNMLVSLSEPTREMTKKKDKFFAKPVASDIVAYSKIFDHVFALHTYVLLLNNGKRLTTGYISPSVNQTKKAEQVMKDFPNMVSPFANSVPSNNKDDYVKGKASLGNSLNMTLAMLRLKYTVMCNQAQRAGAADKRVIDEFYKEDLSLKEISWLATILSDQAKLVSKEPEKTNALSQLSYVPTGADPSVQLYGEANRRTVFYYMDIPLLKEVMLEYFYVFNNMTISSIYAIGSNQKEGPVTKALWGSITRRTSTLFENAEVVPHKFFAGLFPAVNAVISIGEITSFDPYPPTWTDTSILAQLTLDPSETETTLTAEEYTLRLKEYLEYIYLRYSSRPRVAAAILTAIEGYRIKEAMDYQALRTGFIDMIQEHAKKSQLKTTSYTLPVYQIVLAIMRAELQIPLQLRDDYNIEGYESAAQKAKLKDELDDENRNTLKPLSYPPGHPRYIAPEVPEEAPGQVKTVNVVPAMVVAEADLIDKEVEGTPVSFGDYKPPTFAVSTDAAGDITGIKIKDGGENWREGDALTIELPGPAGVGSVTRELTVGRVS